MLLYIIGPLLQHYYELSYHKKSPLIRPYAHIIVGRDEVDDNRELVSAKQQGEIYVFSYILVGAGEFGLER